MLMHRTIPPPYKIDVPPSAQPFKVVAMDLITQLPNSNRHNAILTIVDHGCTRAALFLPCTTNMTGEGITKLYLDNVYRWFGIPSKIISDRDPQFTSYFSTALCQRLRINRNISTAYHPQTDGLSERKNQWVEQYLRLVTSASQDDWSDWLAIATAVHNYYPNTTMQITPIEALFGYSPKITMELPYPLTTIQLIDDRTRKAMEKRKQAKEALNEAARAAPSDSYQVGDKVWLEVKHLALPYQTPKLAPKRHGPFTITKRVSPVAYQLQLPTAWTIHDVFHASLLTPYRETTEHGANYTRPPPDLIEDAEEYEVEAIINHHHFRRKQQLQYLVKWKGYPDADNTWESADHVHAPTLTQNYHRKNPLSPSEQDKRGQKKCNVSICSLKSYLQQHFHTTTTCLSPPRAIQTPSPMTSRSSLSKQSSPPPPSLSSTPLPSLSPVCQPLSPYIPPLNAHTSPSPLTLIQRKARSFPASIATITPSPCRVPSTLCRDTRSSTWALFEPSPLVSPTWPSAVPSNILRPSLRLSSSARSLLISVQKCHANQTQSVQKGLKKTTVDFPISPSPTLTVSYAKPDTSNWATAQSPLPSEPSARKAILSSSTTYSPPPLTYATFPLSHCPCGSLMPSLGSHLPIIKPWTWPAAWTIGAWWPRSPAITRLTLASSISRPKSTRLIVSYRSSKQPLAKAVAISRGPVLNSILEPFRLSTLVAPFTLTHMPGVSVSPVVGHHS